MSFLIAGVAVLLALGFALLISWLSYHDGQYWDQELDERWYEEDDQPR